jgi:hypothetical protein
VGVSATHAVAPAVATHRFSTTRSCIARILADHPRVSSCSAPRTIVVGGSS